MTQLHNSINMLMHSHTNRIGRAKFGIVSALDYKNGLVKVRLQPENCETGWICDAAISVGEATIYSPSPVGTHVFVDTAHGDGDNYVVVSRVFDSTTPPQTFTCLDNQPVSVGQFGIKTGNIEFFVDKGGIKIISNVEITGNVTVSGDVKASGISLADHTHSGVKAGTDSTSPPQ